MIETEIQKKVHRKIIENQDQLTSWFRKQREGYSFPFYTSVDIRDSGCKVVAVDANIYPAGFNNICQVDQEHMPEIMGAYIKRHYGEIKKIVLLTEEHTSNLYYWDNVYTLYSSIKEAGFDVRVSIPKSFHQTTQLRSASGKTIEVFPSHRKNDSVEIGSDGFVPDLIISNNDFSESYAAWAEGLSIPINPPRELGWYQRKKSSHFKYYNELAKGFAELIGEDPCRFQVRTEVYKDFDVSSENGIHQLAAQVDHFIEGLKKEYQEKSVQQKPFAFIKNNAGTYGMGVVPVSSGEDVLEWNAKAKKKLKVGKGGKETMEVIIQEGVPSIIKSDVGTAEPTIYIVGCELVGGFLRTHSKKGPEESLNSPGAVFKRLCVSDLLVDVEGSPLENVYGWISMLSSLAIGREAKELGVNYLNYKPFTC